jgi:6-phosphogluconate dehydrogenase
MQIGVLGMHALGAAVTRRLARRGVAVRVYARERAALDALRQQGAIAFTRGVKALCQQLAPPRQLLLFVADARLLAALARWIEPGDCIADCAEGDLRACVARAQRFKARGALVADLGLFAAPGSEAYGFGLAIGGEAAAFERLKPLADKLGVEGGLLPAGVGAIHAGPPGSGHFLQTLQGLLLESAVAGSAEALQHLVQAPASLASPPLLARVWEAGKRTNARLEALCESYLSLAGGDAAPSCPAVDLARAARTATRAAAGYLEQLRAILRERGYGA